MQHDIPLCTENVWMFWPGCFPGLLAKCTINHVSRLLCRAARRWYQETGKRYISSTTVTCWADFKCSLGFLVGNIKLFEFSNMGRMACFPSTSFLELAERFILKYTLALTIKKAQINLRKKHCRKFQPTSLSLAVLSSTKSREVVADDLNG